MSYYGRYPKTRRSFLALRIGSEEKQGRGVGWLKVFTQRRCIGTGLHVHEVNQATGTHYILGGHKNFILSRTLLTIQFTDTVCGANGSL